MMIPTGVSKRFQLFVHRLLAIADHVRAFVGSSLARKLMLALFVVQAVMLACITGIGVPPDETNHIRFIEYYANHTLSPIFSNQQPTYNLGDKTREVDYLYHYSMSLVYRALQLSTEGKYIVIRLFSVAFALLTFLLLAKVLKRVGLSAGTITVGLLLLTNLPMVLMMSAAINNDVLVWLGMVLGIFLLLRLWQKPSTTDILWLLTLSVIGGLVKRTLLPIGLLFGILALIIIIRQYRLLLLSLKRPTWHILLVSIVLIISIGLFAERVGGNIMQYHTITPSCEQVDGDEACRVFWPNIRAQSLAQRTPEQIISLPMFILPWVYNSLDNVLDIQTQNWQHQVQPGDWLTVVLGLLLLAGVAYGFYFDSKKRRQGRQDILARYRLYILLLGLYFMTVHLLVNYQSYQELKFFGIALNGRYIIPSLLPLVVLSCFYWSRLLARHMKLLAAIAVTAILCVVLGSGLQLMIRNPQLRFGCAVSSSLPAHCD